MRQPAFGGELIDEGFAACQADAVYAVNRAYDEWPIAATASRLEIIRLECASTEKAVFDIGHKTLEGCHRVAAANDGLLFDFERYTGDGGVIRKAAGVERQNPEILLLCRIIAQVEGGRSAIKCAAKSGGFTAFKHAAILRISRCVGQSLIDGVNLSTGERDGGHGIQRQIGDAGGVGDVQADGAVAGAAGDGDGAGATAAGNGSNRPASDSRFRSK